MRRLLPLAVLPFLAACAAPIAPFESTDPAPPISPTEQAAEQFPGVDVNAIAACVRENATEGELALMALGGTEAQTATAQVLGRPETQACLQRSDLTLPGVSS